MKVRVLLAIALAAVLAGCVRPSIRAPAPRAAIIPAPQSLALAAGNLHLTGAVNVTTDAGAPNARRALDAALSGVGLATSAPAAPRLQLRLVNDSALGDEGYRLTIDDGITLAARTDAGLFYAVETLRQLLPAPPVAAGTAITLPHLAITDTPAYRWRGSSLDVARSFLPISYLKAHIDRMAFFKLNRLHLHLTDDQGWRIEIKRYPRLTEVGGASAVKGGRPGFYTQAELKDLVAYAAARNVTIVPEIDLPSHIQAAISAYPELACNDVTNLGPYDGLDVGFNILCQQKPEVIYPFVRNVLTEVAAIFPSEYLHIGGDEIKNPLYPDFVARTAGIVNDLGRKAIVWEEGSVADTRPDTLLQLWNDKYDTAPATAKGHQWILSPCSYFYLDHGNYPDQPNTQTWCRNGVPLDRVYSFDPRTYPPAAGVEGDLWSEFVHTDAATDNRLWPRLAAVAEVAWRNPAAPKDYPGFLRRLRALRPQFDAMHIQYYDGAEVWGNAAK
ncbi:MAG TPA: beta-N-acetylhexosaminidase [Rhodanobacter sp.]|nr:beta-N-acetylhexosaminidase [Rhodanobacter sp.]